MRKNSSKMNCIWNGDMRCCLSITSPYAASPTVLFQQFVFCSRFRHLHHSISLASSWKNAVSSRIFLKRVASPWSTLRLAGFKWLPWILAPHLHLESPPTSFQKEAICRLHVSFRSCSEPAGLYPTKELAASWFARYQRCSQQRPTTSKQGASSTSLALSGQKHPRLG